MALQAIHLTAFQTLNKVHKNFNHLTNIETCRYVISNLCNVRHHHSSLRPVRASRCWAEIQWKGKSSEPCPSPNLGILILQDSCQRMKSLADFSLHVFDYFLVQPLLLFVLFCSFQSAWLLLYAHVHYLRTIYLPCLCLQTSFHYLTTFPIFNANVTIVNGWFPEDFDKHNISYGNCPVMDGCDTPVSSVIVNAQNGSRYS